jgi:hypothetical protein
MLLALRKVIDYKIAQTKVIDYKKKIARQMPTCEEDHNKKPGSPAGRRGISLTPGGAAV